MHNTACTQTVRQEPEHWPREHAVQPRDASGLRAAATLLQMGGCECIPVLLVLLGALRDRHCSCAGPGLFGGMA